MDKQEQEVSESPSALWNYTLHLPWVIFFWFTVQVHYMTMYYNNLRNFVLPIHCPLPTNSSSILGRHWQDTGKTNEGKVFRCSWINKKNNKNKYIDVCDSISVFPVFPREIYTDFLAIYLYASECLYICKIGKLARRPALSSVPEKTAHVLPMSCRACPSVSPYSFHFCC